MIGIWLGYQKVTAPVSTTSIIKQPQNLPIKTEATNINNGSDENNDSDAEESATKSPPSPIQQQVLSEIKQRLFSDDPYVELYSMEWIIELCQDHSPTKVLIKNAINYQQQELSQSMQQKCDLVQTRYPALLAINDRDKLNNLFKPQSQLGRLLKHSKNHQLTEFEGNEVSKQLLILAIKEGNSSIMMQSGLMHRWGNGSMFPLSQVLGTHNQQYASQLSSIAINLISCQSQQGLSCESTSSIMIFACLQDPQACGRDYESWYQLNTLPGMKRDVQKLMLYYQQFSL